MDSGFKRGISCWHRRSGKDKSHINFTAKKSFQRVGTYYYYFPTQALARKIIWNGMDKDGFRFMDHFPKDTIVRSSDRDMMVEFAWGSIFQIIGTDQLDVVGTNPVGCVFSEYSLQNPKAWQYIQPILRENDGWAIFNFTPRGHNHAYELLQKVKHDPAWFTEVLTIDDTGAVDPAEVEHDVRLGLISEELARQEYYCSFEVGVEGAYLTQGFNRMDAEGRIGFYPINLSEPVYTFWDLGQDNAQAIWFAQFYNNEIHLIDHYENNNEGMGHYAQILKDKNYDYGGHYAPWDVVKRESNGLTVQRNAEKVGIFFERVKRTNAITDDVELIRRMFPRIFINEDNCHYGITCLRQWHAKKNKTHSKEERPVFEKNPDHDWTSNTADALRTLMRAFELRMIRPKPYAKITSGERPAIHVGTQNYITEQKTKRKPHLWEQFGNGNQTKKKSNYLKK